MTDTKLIRRQMEYMLMEKPMTAREFVSTSCKDCRSFSMIRSQAKKLVKFTVGPPVIFYVGDNNFIKRRHNGLDDCLQSVKRECNFDQGRLCIEDEFIKIRKH